MCNESVEKGVEWLLARSTRTCYGCWAACAWGRCRVHRIGVLSPHTNARCDWGSGKNDNEVDEKRSLFFIKSSVPVEGLVGRSSKMRSLTKGRGGMAIEVLSYRPVYDSTRRRIIQQISDSWKYAHGNSAGWYPKVWKSSPYNLATGEKILLSVYSEVSSFNCTSVCFLKAWSEKDRLAFKREYVI